MTMTPWGESGRLRDRKLQPGPGVPREEIERNQRERLYGATVAVVAGKGYGPTTIADLIDVAGVSRTTFYSYFADKEACLLATLELIVAGVLAATRTRMSGEEPLPERAEAGLRTFLKLLAAQPDAARLCVVEADAAGPRAVAIVDAAADQFAQILHSAYAEAADQPEMPDEIVTALIGGARKLLQTRLHRGTEGELLAMVPALIGLWLAYKPPPGPLPDRPRRTKVAPCVERSEGIDEPAQRLELATMAVVAREGYAEATMAAIAREAHVSLATLYANFSDKADLFEAALLRSHLRMATVALPAYRRASGWPEAITALLKASLAFLEAEPDFARLVAVDVPRAGAGALEQRDRALESTAGFIAAGLDYAEIDNPVAAEAIQSVLYAMLATRVRSRRSRNLQGLAPLAIYMILAPLLGPAEAYRHAVGEA